MTTIVIHGTQVTNPKAVTWWWKSWHPKGFLGSLSGGMEEVSTGHDVWRIKGRPVEKVAELVPKRSWWSGFRGKSWGQVEGHFLWGGAPMGIGRDAGAKMLVDYLNQIRELTDEPLRIVAHSHGCNIVKLAAGLSGLSPELHISQAVFLACPHSRDAYKFPAQRFGRILNLYFPNDEVQAGMATYLSGGTLSGRLADYTDPTTYRVEQDPAVQHLYENVELATAAGCSGTQAHTVIHGALIGHEIGVWLSADAPFNSDALPPIPVNDDGA